MTADNIQGLETLEAWKRAKDFGYIAYLKRAKVGANEPGAGHAVREDAALYFDDRLEDSELLEINKPISLFTIHHLLFTILHSLLSP